MGSVEMLCVVDHDTGRLMYDVSASGSQDRPQLGQVLTVGVPLAESMSSPAVKARRLAIKSR